MRVHFSSPVRFPSRSGTISSAIQPSQMPSSIASFTTPTALSSVARACEKQSTATRNTACRFYPRHSHPPQIDSRPGLYRRVGDACRATSRVGDSHLDCRAAPRQFEAHAQTTANRSLATALSRARSLAACWRCARNRNPPLAAHGYSITGLGRSTPPFAQTSKSPRHLTGSRGPLNTGRDP